MGVQPQKGNVPEKDVYADRAEGAVKARTLQQPPDRRAVGHRQNQQGTEEEGEHVPRVSCRPGEAQGRRPEEKHAQQSRPDPLGKAPALFVPAGEELKEQTAEKVIGEALAFVVIRN